MFTLEEFMARVKPGDILLTSNPAGLGKLINFGQGIEDPGRSGSRYGHVAIVCHSKEDRMVWKPDGHLYESVMTISRNHIDKYHRKQCCIIRHTSMDAKKYYKGLQEVEDNIGQPYPAHRIVLHGFDMINSWIKRAVFRRKAPLKFRYMKLMPLDWPVCSELGAQFIHAAGLKGGWEERKSGWRGVNPDDFYDAAVINPQRWQMIFEGVFISA